MSVRARLSRLSSAVMVAALIAGASMLAAPAAQANEGPAEQTSVAPLPQTDTEPSPGEDVAVADDAAPAPVEPIVPPAPETLETVTPGTETPATPAPDTSAEPVESETTPEGTPEGTEKLADEEVRVTAGSLTWGIRSSFVSYVAKAGTVVGLGAVATANGGFVWNAGSGTLNADGTGSIEFPATDGVQFEAHGGALDLGLMHPRIELTSPTTGNLFLDVVVSGNVTPDVHFATLSFAAATVSGTEREWSNAAATLTEDGATAFNGMYAAGESLDDMTFSTTPTQVAPVVQTTTSIAVDKTSVTEGDTVTLTATVAPAAAMGTVQFFNGTTKLGEAVPVAQGAATLSTTKLPIGTHDISAEFTPADPSSFSASASEVNAKVTVAKRAAVTETQVTSGSLTWGVRSEFRNYIYNFTAFEGRSKLLGQTAQPVAKGEFVWPKGAGTTKTDGSAAKVNFGSGNGVHFQSHPQNDQKSIYALDLKFTNPTVVVTSPTKGELLVDVEGREFVDMSTTGKPYVMKQVAIASLALPAPEANGKKLTWKKAAATLTEDGAAAFGGFYEPGEKLDPLTFSFNTDTSVTGKTPTSTMLSASATKVPVGTKSVLTAKVAPNVAGTVTFYVRGKAEGKAVAVTGGVATTTLTLPSGVQPVSAAFTPANSSYGHSVSNVISITVDKKKETPPDTKAPGNGAKAAGSLSWGVSTAFADYVTGPIAKGRVTTSGVGSSGGVYLFPQASGGSWNATTHTGSVQYSGSVTYEGHKGLLHEGVSNPRIDVTGPTTAVLYSGGARWATLDLGAATKSVGANGEVTWSGVPVNGGFTGGAGGDSSYTLPADGLSFTVGAASGVSYGSTSVSNADKKRTVAETAPTTTGIRVLTAPDEITAGAELEFEAAGFEAGEREMIVAMYPGPIVLDEAAGANSAGTVRWLGTLPEDLASGEYIITVQGSTDAGAVMTVVDEKEAKAAKKKKREAEALLAEGVNGEAVAAAGIAPLSTGPVWLWWVGAGSLLLIASTMGGLVALQRRAAAQS